MELLDPLHRRPDELLQPDEFLGALELGDLEDPMLGVVEHVHRRGAPFVRLLEDGVRRVDQPAQHGFVADDPGVVLDVRRGRHDVDEGADVLHAARAIQVAAAHQLVAQRHRVDHVATLGQGDHGAEQQPVPFTVEHRVVEELGGLEGRVLVEEHGAEDGLLRFVALRSLAPGELPLRRGDGGRRGRHPRSASSNGGF